MSTLDSAEFKEIEKYAHESGSYTRVLEIIEPLARLGNAEAQCYLATAYHLGLGVIQDALIAIKWYEISSHQGYALASHNLSTLYATGTSNFAENPKLAAHWQAVAVSQGFPQ